MVCAWTGSGKTLMFLLSFLQQLSESEPAPAPAAGRLRPEALVLVPTPELAGQVSAVAQRLAAALADPPVVSCLTEVASTPADRSVGTRLLVSTPSFLLPRLLDGRVLADEVRMVAIDEADA